MDKTLCSWTLETAVGVSACVCATSAAGVKTSAEYLRVNNFAVVCYLLQQELSPEGPRLQCVKMDVTGGPVFSLQQGIKPKFVDPNTKQAKPVIYLGLAAKEIAAWQPDQLTFNDKVQQQLRSMEGGQQSTVTACTRSTDSLHCGPHQQRQPLDTTALGRTLHSCGDIQVCSDQEHLLFSLLQVRMNGHTGYVRSLATSGKYLFSCGCNYLRQWDQAFAVPKEVSSKKLFKGDILAIACGDKRVFTAGADGVLRSWSIGKTGELMEAAVREKAHDGRITSIMVNASLLYSAGYDGTIKVGVSSGADTATPGGDNHSNRAG